MHPDSPICIKFSALALIDEHGTVIRTRRVFEAPSKAANQDLGLFYLCIGRSHQEISASYICRGMSLQIKAKGRMHTVKYPVVALFLFCSVTKHAVSLHVFRIAYCLKDFCCLLCCIHALQGIYGAYQRLWLPQIMQSVQGSRSSALRRIRIGCRKPAVLTGQVVFLPGIFFIFSPAKFRTAEYDVLPAVIHLPPDTQPCFRYYCTETEPFLFAVKHHRIVPFWICTGHFFSFSTGIRNAVIVGGQQSGKRGNDKRMHRNSFQPDFYQCLSSASVRIFNGSDSQKEEKLLDFFQVVRIFL